MRLSLPVQVVGIRKKTVTAGAELLKTAEDGRLETRGPEAGEEIPLDVPAAGLVVPVKVGAFGNKKALLHLDCNF